MTEEVQTPDMLQPDADPAVTPVPTGPVLFYAEGDTKADVRKKVWEHLESNKLASFPRPVLNRIPNYKGSPLACDKAADLEIFQQANIIKINPDKPQEQARFKTLEAKKTLLVPTPRLRHGLFNRIEPPNDTKPTLRFCSTSQGVRQHSTPLGLDMKVKVDLVIVGSVAVSTKGWRIGKGEGFADLEYGMMAAIGAVDDNTIVVSTVHDHQVMDLPDELFGPHDITVDFICTPTRVIECSRKPKPKGIIWSLLTVEKFARVPILKVLREQERSEGKDVTLFGASTEEELEQALKDAAILEEERDKEREARQKERDEARERGEFPKRRQRRNRRRGPPTEGEEGEHGEQEHADGEGSPSGGERRRQNRPPRRRNRRRNRDSERQGSEGEQPAADDREGEGEGDTTRRRRPRRPRNRPNRPSGGEPTSGTENDDQHQDRDGQKPDGPRRPRRYSNRNRNRRSEGDEGDRQDYDDRRQQNRRPYRNNNRRPPRNDDHIEDGENSADSQGEDRRRQRPRRNNNLPTVYVGSLPKAVRVSTFKKQVRDLDVNPLRVLWRGVNGHVFLIFQSMDETEDALKKLEHLSINDKEVKVALANRTERRKNEQDGNVDNDRGSGDNLKPEGKMAAPDNNEGTTTL